MQAIILAAGKSTRTYPLTLTRPKPLLKVGGKTLLEWNLDALVGSVDEIIVVIGYKKQMMLDYYEKIKEKYSFTVTFVEQKEQLGTGHALLQVKDKVKGKFVLLMGDDVYSKEDVQKCMKHDLCILARRVKDPSRFGVLVLDNNGKVKDMVEKPSIPVSDLANCALYVLDERIFKLLEKLKVTERGEYEIIDGLNAMFREQYFDYEEASNWQPVGYPWDLLALLKKKIGKEGFVGENCEVSGQVKGSSMGDNCIIKGKVVNSVLLDHVVVEEGSKVEDSVLGEGVLFKGTMKAGEQVKSLVKDTWVMVDKVGGVLGDKVIAEQVTLEPGVKVWPGKKITGKITEDVR